MLNFFSRNLSQTKNNGSANLLILVPAAFLKAKTWLKTFDAKTVDRITKALSRRTEALKAGERMRIAGIEKSDADIFVGVLPEDMTTFEVLSFFRSLLKEAVQIETGELGAAFLGKFDEGLVADCLGAALATRIFKMPEYGKRAEKSKTFKLKSVSVYANKNLEKSLRYGFETGEGTNLVRYLGTLPPNELDTGEYAKRIQKFAKDAGFQYKFHSNKELKRMGAGAFTAVDQADPDSKGGIHELTYSPSKAKNKSFVALVGKGLCYDTGGYDIKTQGYMARMKGDMQGSAVALSTLLTAKRLKWPLKMKAFLGVTENHVSPRGYKADDVVTALNGLTIEVVNTDAEGRMVLADTLALASKTKPELIMDFATLTGGAVYSIGTTYGAAFTNKEKLHSRIVDCGKRSGERVWTFPLDKDFGKNLESPIADTLQCSRARGIDHILAAFFLNRFVGEGIPWVHLDLSAADRDGGLAHVDSLFTGFGVRFALEFLKTSYRV